MENINMGSGGEHGGSFILSEIPFFKEFTPEEISFLTNNCKPLNFKAGDFLLNMGMEANRFYFIISGNVSIQVFSKEDGIIELESAEDGDFLGCSWITKPYKCSFNAVAFTETRTVAFDAIEIKRRMEADHEFGYKIYRFFTDLLLDRFQAARENIVALYENSF